MLNNELIVDSFAGGGGASTGIEAALGVYVDIAINHDPEALTMHAKNHPHTAHYCEDVWAVDPREVCHGQKVGLMWLSPDCKHFSRAKGGKPVEKKIRGLAWIAVRWARAVRPRVIVLENVEEFKDWGPLGKDGRPDQLRKGLTFRRFVGSLRNLGYQYDIRSLRACDYGAPTTRKRLFLIARCDGKPIVWPKPTHSDDGLLAPYRTAAECIDWSIPCPSIFDRERPLAENTQRRIAAGIRKYVLESARPFIVPLTHGGGPERVHSADEPLRTITTAHRGELALINPFLVGAGGPAYGGKPTDATKPFGALLTENHKAIVAPLMIQRGYGEREGQAPRSLDIGKPLGTAVAGGIKHGLVAAFLAKHNGIGAKMVVGQGLDESTHTITSQDQKALVTSHLINLKGTTRRDRSAEEPAPTVTGQGLHIGEVRAFLMKFYSEGGQWASLHDPMHTIPTKDRMALVTVEGQEYVIADIGMRMLTPAELFRAQGFPEDYDITVEGLLTKTAQVRMCGNSVCPPVAEAIVRAQFNEASEQEQAA